MAISRQSDLLLNVKNAALIQLQKVSSVATFGPTRAVVSRLDSRPYISANSRLEGTLEIKQGRMVHLGYGKYWRSDEIVGLFGWKERFRLSPRPLYVWNDRQREMIVPAPMEERIPVYAS